MSPQSLNQKKDSSFSRKYEFELLLALAVFIIVLVFLLALAIVQPSIYHLGGL